MCLSSLEFYIYVKKKTHFIHKSPLFETTLSWLSFQKGSGQRYGVKVSHVTPEVLGFFS